MYTTISDIDSTPYKAISYVLLSTRHPINCDIIWYEVRQLWTGEKTICIYRFIEWKLLDMDGIFVYFRDSNA